eukprot:scaffold1086_cov397-Prasinococcus_capsulatus_cf.AAC.11
MVEPSPERVKGTWTSQEDFKLIQLVARLGTRNWSRVAQEVPGRTGKSCRLRYSPGHRCQLQTQMRLIALGLPCACNRWTNQLDPKLKKGPFTPEEDHMVAEAHKIYGNRWSLLSSLLPGRSDNAIKNRWNSSLKRKYPHDEKHMSRRLKDDNGDQRAPLQDNHADGMVSVSWSNRRFNLSQHVGNSDQESDGTGHAAAHGAGPCLYNHKGPKTAGSTTSPAHLLDAAAGNSGLQHREPSCPQPSTLEFSAWLRERRTRKRLLEEHEETSSPTPAKNVYVHHRKPPFNLQPKDWLKMELSADMEAAREHHRRIPSTEFESGLCNCGGRRCAASTQGRTPKSQRRGYPLALGYSWSSHLQTVERVAHARLGGHLSRQLSDTRQKQAPENCFQPWLPGIPEINNTEPRLEHRVGVSPTLVSPHQQSFEAQFRCYGGLQSSGYRCLPREGNRSHHPVEIPRHRKQRPQQHSTLLGSQEQGTSENPCPSGRQEVGICYLGSQIKKDSTLEALPRAPRGMCGNGTRRQTRNSSHWTRLLELPKLTAEDSSSPLPTESCGAQEAPSKGMTVAAALPQHQGDLLDGCLPRPQTGKVYYQERDRNTRLPDVPIDAGSVSVTGKASESSSPEKYDVEPGVSEMATT